MPLLQFGSGKQIKVFTGLRERTLSSHFLVLSKFVFAQLAEPAPDAEGEARS
jgi:hypothetical protein